MKVIWGEQKLDRRRVKENVKRNGRKWKELMAAIHWYLKSKFCATLHLHWVCHCGVRHQRNCVYANCLQWLQDRIANEQQTQESETQSFFLCGSGSDYGMNRNFFFCLFVWFQYANNAWLIKSVWVPNVQMAQRWKQQEFRLAFACRNLRRNRFTVFHEAKTWQKRNEWTKNTAKTLIALWLFKSSWFKSVWFIVVEKNGAQKKKIYFFFAQNSQANRHTHNHTAHT